MKDFSKLFKTLISTKSLIVGVVGLGYVGLPLANSFASKGIQTIGFDVDKKKIKLLRNNDSYIDAVSSKNLRDYKKFFQKTDDFKNISRCDLVIICVPTPLNINKEPDLSFIKNTINTIMPFLKKGQMLSLESTTYPGSTREVIGAPLLSQGFNLGQDFFLVYSPEREDPGNKDHTNESIPKILGGYSKNCSNLGKLAYSLAIDKIISVSSMETAELTKLLENIYRLVNISLVNEMKILASKMQIDINEVIDSAATKPFGFSPFYPGPGIGGHCIPVDPFYLTWKAKEYGIHTKFISTAAEVNDYMPRYVAENIAKALNSVKKSINQSKILLLGASYKKNISDYRESPSLQLIEILKQDGAKVTYSDPYVPSIIPTRLHDLNLNSVAITKASLSSQDLVVLLTDHDAFNYEQIANYSKLIVDTRNKFKKLKLSSKKIYQS